MGFDAQDDPVAARRLLGYLHGNPKFYRKMTAAGPAVLPCVPPTLPGGIAIPPGFIPPGFHSASVTHQFLRRWKAGTCSR